MYSLTRLLFRALNGKPVAQVLVGIALIPVGILISIASMSGEYIFPYWIVAGIVFAIVGVVFIVRGARTLLTPKSSVQRPYVTPNQYVPPQPYTGPNQYVPPQPYVAPNQYAPSQPYANPNPYTPYGQSQPPQPPYMAPNPYAPQQQPYMPPAYSQPYEQVQYPQE